MPRLISRLPIRLRIENIFSSPINETIFPTNLYPSKSFVKNPLSIIKFWFDDIFSGLINETPFTTHLYPNKSFVEKLNIIKLWLDDTFPGVRDDFQKLVLARADHRVIIFKPQTPHQSDSAINALLDEVRVFQQAVCGDKFLFGCWNQSERGFDWLAASVEPEVLG